MMPRSSSRRTRSVVAGAESDTRLPSSLKVIRPSACNSSIDVVELHLQTAASPPGKPLAPPSISAVLPFPPAPAAFPVFAAPADFLAVVSAPVFLAGEHPATADHPA